MKLALMIEDGLGEAVPDFIAHCLPGKFSGRLFLLLAKLFIRFRAAGDADYG